MNDTTKYGIMKNRELLKGYGSWDAGQEATDQQQRLPPLPSVKPQMSDRALRLPMDFSQAGAAGMSFGDIIQSRKSRRIFEKTPLPLGELSFLLWATQGIKREGGAILGKRQEEGTGTSVTFRNVPSAGSRHALETYLFVNCVEGLEKGIYHYLPQNHQLECLDSHTDFSQDLLRAVCNQRFAAEAPVLFAWSALPYRMEWRYGMKAAKYILLDAGHVCQNLYLSCENLGLGACAVGAYDQELMDELLGFPPGPNGERDYECTVYMAAVGRQISVRNLNQLNVHPE